MRIGVPRETLDHEYRVGATPDTVSALTAAGHTVLVETSAGAAIGYTDDAYAQAGADITTTPYDADLIVKVKGPLPPEYPLLRTGQTVCAFFHLAANPDLAAELDQRGVQPLAYETVEDADGRLPLLRPMSEIAGRIATQVGATSLYMAHGGCGVLLGPSARVLIIGGGTVGTFAANSARALGAHVTVMDVPLGDLAGELARAHLVIGAALIPGEKTPKLITREMVSTMIPGSVLVDVSIDQGGISETSRPTTHSEPRYIDSNVVHYCVTNMPAACARTATQALTTATLPHLLQLAVEGG